MASMTTADSSSIPPALTSPSTATRRAMSMSTEIPLNSPSRTRPIHPLLPDIKVPASISPPLSSGLKSDTADQIPAFHYHPITCEPFTAEDLAYHKFQALQQQYSTPEAAEQALQESIKEVKERIEENQKKRREIEKEIEMKEKTRELERKLYMNMKQSKSGGTQTKE